MTDKVIEKLECFLDSLANINSEWVELRFPIPEKDAEKVLNKLNKTGYDVYSCNKGSPENQVIIVLTTETM